MLNISFMTGPMPSDAIAGVYDGRLVAASYIAAALASYMALLLTRLLVNPRSHQHRLLLKTGGALALGAGVWSMHFIGMLAYKMDMPVNYDPWLTGLSLLVAVISGYGVLAIVGSPRLGLGKIITGALLLGTGISAMHYIGMAAMLMDADMRYRPDIFLLSVAIAVTASCAALWICHKMARRTNRAQGLKVAAALIMAAAICGMHYTGMAAAVFTPHMTMHGTENRFSMGGIALIIAIVGIGLILILPIVVYRTVREDQDTGPTAAFPTRLLILSMVFTVIALFWLFGNIFFFGHKMEEIEQGLKLDQSISDIVYLASSSAQASKQMVNTAEPIWEAEQNANTAQINILLTESLQKDLDPALHDRLLLIQKDETLVAAMEKNAVAAIHDGYVDKARSLITEQDYAEARQDFSEECRVLSENIARTLDHKLSLFYETIHSSLYMGLGGSLFLIVAWYFVLLRLKQWQGAMRAARREAVASNIAKSDFLANMSHELRTPLNSILGMTRLLQESNIDPEQRVLADTVFTSSGILLEIVNDILDLSKIEAGGIQLENIGFDLSYVMRSVIDRLNPLAREKNLPPIDFINSSPPYVLGDPTRVTRILTNLISNALKYTDYGLVQIKAAHRVIDGGHLLYRCEVIDSGIGIAADKHAGIFDKFVQADTSTTRKYGGTGLGLAITKQLVELMGGTIGLQSEIGKGSTFWFEIPFSITDTLYREKSSAQTALRRGTMAPADARVLIAEDHPMNQALARKLMERFGIGHFKIVENGVDAIESYRASTWDMILMDCHMPEKNGYDATLAIRQMEKETGAHIPVIAMTANAMIGDREKCLRYGMDEYISKPIVMEEFARIIGQWIDLGDRMPKNESAKNVAAFAIDLSQMRTFTDGDAVMERELISIFIRQSETNIQTLSAHQTDGVSKEWSEAAHMMKGGAAGIGAEKLRALCATAQDMAETATAAARSALLSQIEIAYKNVKTALKNEGLLETQ